VRFSTTEKYTYLSLSFEEAKKENPEITEFDFAEKLGVSLHTLQRAVVWRRKQIYNLSDPSLLAAHIQSLKEHVKKYEKMQDIILKGAPAKNLSGEARAKTKIISGNALTGLARVILDYRTRVMELEGIYRQVVNIDHGGFIPKTFAEWIKFNEHSRKND